MDTGADRVGEVQGSLVPASASDESRWSDLSRRRIDAARAWQERDLQTLTAMVRAYGVLRANGGFKKTTWAPYAVYAPRFFEWMWEHCKGLNPTVDLGRLLATAIRRGEFTATNTPSQGTQHNALKVCKLAAETMRWAGMWDTDMFMGVGISDRVPNHTKRHPYSPDEVMRILDACRGDWNTEVVIRLGLDAGLRLSEIAALRWCDVNLENKELVVVSGKGDMRRQVYIGSGTLYHLLADNYLTQRSGEDAEPTSRIAGEGDLRGRMQQFFMKARVDYGMHRLRHTCARDLLSLGGSLEAVQLHLGHKNITTTQIYARMAANSYKSCVDQRVKKSEGTGSGTAAASPRPRHRNDAQVHERPVDWPQPVGRSSTWTHERAGATSSST